MRSLVHFKPMRLIFMNYSVYLPQIPLSTCALMMAWWQRPKHVATLNKIDIHNVSCVLTCELLLLTVYIELNGVESPKEYIWSSLMKFCAINCCSKHNVMSWLWVVRNIKQIEILCVCVISQWQLDRYMYTCTVIGETLNKNTLYWLFVTFML
jgi:hypothetical protein